MKARILYQIRASWVKAYRKLFSFVTVKILSRLSSFKMLTAGDSNYSGLSYLGSANVLEVFVPYLTLDRQEKLFNTDILEPRMFEELGYWMDEMRVLYEAENLIYNVTDNLPQSGWDDVTGMRGRVVSIDIWGLKQEAVAINRNISDMVVKLGETYTPVSYGKKKLKLVQDEQAEVLREETKNKIKELMQERSKKIGDVKFLQNFDNLT